MAAVIAELTMSLDGFVADRADRVGPLFAWYENGDVEVPTAVAEQWTFHTSDASAGYLRASLARTGAVLGGRRVYDIGRWGEHGQHPWGVPVFVVTHEVPDGRSHHEPPFTFVTDGIESAIAQAQAAAGDKAVFVASANVARQCLNAGLLDEIVVSLVPVLLGDGIRLFEHLERTPVELDGPRVIEGTGVTHLSYGVRRKRKR